MHIDELNQLDEAGFVAELGGIFEHSPWVAHGAWPKRPFHNVSELHGAMVKVVDSAGEGKQLELIRAHPELAGKAALRGELTDASQEEQSGAGLHLCSPAEFATLQRLNADYNARFGHPFIIAVKGHTRQSIIAHFSRRLQNDAASERVECLQQIYQIAQFRLQSLLVVN